VDRLFALATALLLSLATSLAAVSQLVSHFWYGEDLFLFAVPIMAFALAAIAVFAVAEARARTSAAFLPVAIGLAIAAVALVALPVVVEQIAAQSKNPAVVLRPRSGRIKLALLIPMLLAIVTQWRLVRRGWLRAHAQADAVATTWPWLTTILACGVVLNPLGLAILTSAIERSSTDWLSGLWLAVSLAGAGLLLLIGLIEWRIRRRKLRVAADAAPG
jgi:hypothetical protein